jgi:HD-GYP domain-containing protein (c-di-GMP phosphodiesterase class II)
VTGVQTCALPISLGARMFAVVDSFDAMTSHRPYRRALNYEEARREIARCAGGQFDPKVVAAFESVPPETWEEIHARIAGGSLG